MLKFFSGTLNKHCIILYFFNLNYLLLFHIFLFFFFSEIVRHLPPCISHTYKSINHFSIKQRTEMVHDKTCSHLDMFVSNFSRYISFFDDSVCIAGVVFWLGQSGNNYLGALFKTKFCSYHDNLYQDNILIITLITSLHMGSEEECRLQVVVSLVFRAHGTYLSLATEYPR